jgi:murein DD-endopeptidase MepM/ murein hydrolase activator NlpD
MQTYCGPFTHGRDNQLAYDFWMPIGEELVAARAGVVREVIDRYEDQNLNWREFNLIHIEHADGSTAFYAHLMQDSAVVEVGDQVMAGELIARSGETGTSVPHLHFGVYRTWPWRQNDDLPINFRNAQGPLDARGGLQVDVTYLALPF